MNHFLDNADEITIEIKVKIRRGCKVVI